MENVYIIAALAIIWLVVTMAAFWFLVKVMGFDPKEAMNILREMLELKRTDVMHIETRDRSNDGDITQPTTPPKV